MAELAGHAGRALDDGARLDDPAAQAGADDHRYRRVRAGDHAIVRDMGVEGGGVAVVVIDDGELQPFLQRAAMSKPATAPG
jgi:hypothetical protein